MPPLNKFTTKSREAIKKAHELAIERGVNHVSTSHLLAALFLQEESMVNSILDKLEIDTMLLTDSVLESIELPENHTTLSPSYQIYLNPDLAQVIEQSAKLALEITEQAIVLNRGRITYAGTSAELLRDPQRLASLVVAQ